MSPRSRADSGGNDDPDAPPLPVRAHALAEGKLVYMAVPRLADR